MSQFFAVSFDPDDDCWIVCEKSKSFSFAMVPKYVQHSFHKKDKIGANALVAALNKNVQKFGSVHVQMIQTPGRFEVIADKKYGVKW